MDSYGNKIRILNILILKIALGGEINFTNLCKYFWPYIFHAYQLH